MKTQGPVRRGKLRKHPQGYALNVFLGDDTLLATVYGGSPAETGQTGVQDGKER